MKIRVFYTDNYFRESHSYIAPDKATVADLERYIRSFNNAGYSAWAEIEVAGR